MNEKRLRSYIRKIIAERKSEDENSEGQSTTKLKGGRYKKEIKSMSKVPPGELMKRLNAKPAKNGSDIQNLIKFLDSASTGVDAMAIVYGSPNSKKDSQGREGAKIPLKTIKGAGGSIPTRDARKYIEILMAAGVNSGYIQAPEFQVEILGGAVLVYFSDKKYSWNKQ